MTKYLCLQYVIEHEQECLNNLLVFESKMMVIYLDRDSQEYVKNKIDDLRNTFKTYFKSLKEGITNED